MLDDFHIISKVSEYLDRNYHHEITLEKVSAGIGVSYTKCRQIFRRWSNTEPQILLKYLAKKNYRDALIDGNISITKKEFGYQQIFDTRHKFIINLRVIERNQTLAHRKSMVIRYQFLATRFGRCLIGLESDQICWFSFVDNDQQAIQAIQQYFSGARLAYISMTKGDSIDSFLDEYKNSKRKTLSLSLFGSKFQIQVLNALLKIPKSSCVSYGKLASSIGYVRSARAVGNAIGNNPISYLIPCHRVIRNSGTIGGYRWNASRKGIILAWEYAQKMR
jgi:AraC family transcriptional regulator of adaptative response/methylated-DNA-[protein]-cysteine methyltransferase